MARDVAKLAYDQSEQAARTLEDRQDAELYRVAAYTGLRLGELVALRWDDVNLVDGRLVVHRAFSDRTEGPTKSWQARFIPVAEPAAGAFARLAERRDFTGAEDYVFCSRLGHPLDGSALRRRFKRAAAAAGLRELRFPRAQARRRVDDRSSGRPALGPGVPRPLQVDDDRALPSCEGSPRGRRCPEPSVLTEPGPRGAELTMPTVGHVSGVTLVILPFDNDPPHLHGYEGTPNTASARMSRFEIATGNVIDAP
jgi:hypothetical protein